MHGSLREAECIHCGVRVPMADAVAELPLPACPECGEVLKPGVVMFGEMLPVDAIERAQQLAAEAGLLLVVGSSLEVHPVAGAAGRDARRGRRARDRQPRRHAVGLPRRSSCIDGGAGETLSALAAALGIVEPTDRGGAMADQSNKDLLARLADLSEGAIQRLSEAPGADRGLQALKGLGERVDELQRRTRGFEELEKRLADAREEGRRAGEAEAGAQAVVGVSRPPKTAAAPKKP